MAFTDGQLLFALIFIVIFIITLFFLYRSDIKKLGVHSKGALSVLGIIIFVLLVFYGTVKFLAS
tara:strand:+ start:67412 stop:67603 length:192 start_codon:yes stop_codon:yes gene_type:complete